MPDTELLSSILKLSRGTPEQQANAKRIAELVLLATDQADVEGPGLGPEEASWDAKRLVMKLAVGMPFDRQRLYYYILSTLKGERMDRQRHGDDLFLGHAANLEPVDQPHSASATSSSVELLRIATTSDSGDCDLFTLRILYCLLHDIERYADLADALGENTEPSEVRAGVERIRLRLRRAGVRLDAQRGPKRAATGVEGSERIDSTEFFRVFQAVNGNRAATLSELSGLLQWEERKTISAPREFNKFRFRDDDFQGLKDSLSQIRLPLGDLPQVPQSEDDLWSGINRQLHGVINAFRPSDPRVDATPESPS